MNRPVSHHKCPLICNCKYTTIIYKSNHMDLFHFEIYKIILEIYNKTRKMFTTFALIINHNLHIE